MRVLLLTCSKFAAFLKQHGKGEGPEATIGGRQYALETEEERKDVFRAYKPWLPIDMDDDEKELDDKINEMLLEKVEEAGEHPDKYSSYNYRCDRRIWFHYPSYINRETWHSVGVGFEDELEESNSSSD